METQKISTAKRAVLIIVSILSWLAALFCMVFIFILARMPIAGLEATGQTVSHAIYHALTWRVPVSTLIRAFYVVLYAVLVLLCYFGMITADSASIKRPTVVLPKFIKTKHDIYASFSIWIAFLYAMTDQYHQLFIDRRTASLMELMYNLGGILVMVAFLGLVIRIRTGAIKRRLKRQIALTQKDAKTN